MPKNQESSGKSLHKIYKYYRYDDYSYRIVFDSNVTPVGGAILKSDGSWFIINFGLDLIMENNPPISEAEAFRLAGIFKDK
jgi:hypothetical protein